MRALLVRLHRWAGLFIALFLIVAGLTGAVISWDQEIDAALNPHLHQARPGEAPRSPFELAREIERRHPQVQVTTIPLAVEPEHSLAFSVWGRFNPRTDRLIEPGYNQIFVDPVSGEELGRRFWGAAWPLNRETFVSFLYVLHYSLHLPALGGIDEWGVWLMGGIALLWTIDCFTGFALSLPRPKTSERSADVRADISGKPGKATNWWQRWKPAWQIRWRGGTYKLNFDLHRAGALWTWGLLFIIAFTGFSLNLYEDVFEPAMSAVSEVTPTPYDSRARVESRQIAVPKIPYEAALEIAKGEAARRHWQEPAGAITWSRHHGFYDVAFYPPGARYATGGAVHRTLYVDAHDGTIIGDEEPWKGTAADIFLQAQFPVHSGRILGLPGRILISLMGLVIAMLSVTGIIIWWRKRRARAARQPGRKPARSTVPAGDLHAVE